MSIQKSNFLPILDTWQDYFDNPYEGLGTTYERFILHRLFKLIASNFKIDSVLETPSFGMTGISGINSVWWSKSGKKVIVTDNHLERMIKIKKVWQNLDTALQLVACPADDLPFRDNSVDLVWNFAALWFLSDLKYFASQIKRIARHVIFICVPNPRGVGFILRKYLTPLPPLINLDYTRPAQIINVFNGNGWQLWKEGIFDVPPWPDIPMKKEDLLHKMHLGFILKILDRSGESGPSKIQPTILDYYSDRNANLERETLRYSWLENFPKIFQSVWGHHLFFIFKKEA